MEKNDYAKISSANIKALLKGRHMSTRRLAEKIGAAPTTLNDALKSKKGVPVDLLIKTADYFDITVNDLCNKDLFGESFDEGCLVQSKFNRLDAHGKELVMLVINKELERINGTDKRR